MMPDECTAAIRVIMEDRLLPAVKLLAEGGMMKIFHEELLPLLEQKGHDYTQGNDVMDNFVRGAQRLGSKFDKYDVIIVYLLKHWDAFETWVKNRELKSESIDSRLDDLVNYLLLLRLMRLEDAARDSGSDFATEIRRRYADRVPALAPLGCRSWSNAQFRPRPRTLSVDYLQKMLCGICQGCVGRTGKPNRATCSAFDAVETILEVATGTTLPHNLPGVEEKGERLAGKGAPADGTNR